MLNAIVLFFFSILFILGVVLLVRVSDRSPVRSKKENAGQSYPENAETFAIENFETATPKLFFAGELGGALSFKDVSEQAIRLVNNIAASMNDTHTADYDLVIVGAGPAGLSAALAARMHNLKFIVLEQYSVEKAVADHPGDRVKGTLILELPLAGKFTLKNVSRRQLMDIWQNLILRFRIPIQENCRVLFINALNGSFKVLASENQNFRTKFVLLATGRRKVNQLIPVFKTQNLPDTSEAGKRSIYAEVVI